MSTSRATHFSGVVCAPVAVTSSTITLSEALHAGRPVTLDRAAGITVTLPAASGSGAKYTLTNLTTVTSNSHVVQVANANDYMNGVAVIANDTDASASIFETANTGTAATESDTITQNGTTTGGIVGDIIEITDVAANRWSVRVTGSASGVEATPFSAAV